MLDFTVQQFPFRHGLAEGVEPHQAPAGTLTTAENVCWRKGGKAEKRYGTLQLSDTVTDLVFGSTAIVAAVRLFTRGSELCLTDATNLYSYSPTLGLWHSGGGWRNAPAQLPSVGMTWKTLLDSSTGAASSDIGFYSSGSSGLVVHAWTTGTPQSTTQTALFVQVLDQATGAMVLVPTMLTALSTSATFAVR